MCNPGMKPVFDLDPKTIYFAVKIFLQEHF